MNDISLELRSTMSPKVKNLQIKSTGPSLLALKRYFRKSSNFEKKQNENDSIVLIDESSSRSSSSLADSDNNYQIVNETPVVISSDSENEDDNFTTNFLTNRKFREVANWAWGVKNGSGEISSTSSESFRVFKENAHKNAFNSTCADSVVDKKIEATKALWKKKDDFGKYNGVISDDEDSFSDCLNKSLNSKLKETSRNSKETDVIPDSFEELNNKFSDDDHQENEIISDHFCEEPKTPINRNINNEKSPEDFFVNKNCTIIEDSFEDDLLNLSLMSRLNKKQQIVEQTEQKVKETPEKLVEDLLDGLYGTSWRNSKEQILSKTEPRPKRPPMVTPKTQRRKEKMPTQKYETPWMRIQKIADPDTESDEEEKVIEKPRMKLFEERTETENTKKKTTTKTESAKKGKPTENANGKQLILGEIRTKENVQKKIGKGKLALRLDNDSDNEDLSQRTVSTVARDFSFLESLSENVPILQCDRSARVYRINYKQYKSELAQKLFKLYNEKIFNNKIPADTPLLWNDRMRGTAGFCYCKKIVRRSGKIEHTISRICLSTKVLDSPDRLRDTLVHEMCHAATWIIDGVNDGHGTVWKGWARKAMNVFPELPAIKTSHEYVIHTKYTYKCTNCGYCVGRHTKSIDIERKRCGYCMGKFEILINKLTKSGDTKTTPVTPRKQPSPFAMFVKENYATFKQPNRTHADVMKLLSVKFAEFKIKT